MLFEKGSFLRQNGQRVGAGGMSYGGRERGCQCKSLLLCVRTKRDNILCELCVFAPLGGTIYGQLAEETCSNLQIVVIRLSGAQHPLSSAWLSPSLREESSAGRSDWYLLWEHFHMGGKHQECNQQNCIRHSGLGDPKTERRTATI